MEYTDIKSDAMDDRGAYFLRKTSPSQIAVPPRVSGDGLFKPREVSPSPMTLAASFLVDHDPDPEFRSFTSLMSAEPDSPSFSTAKKEGSLLKGGVSGGGSFAERLAARGTVNSNFIFDSVGYFQDVKPRVDNSKMMPPSSIPINRSTSCLTIPPGLSPTTLFDSPLFSTYQAALSPMTGTYNSFAVGFSNDNGVQMSPQSSESSKGSDVEKEDSSGFVFKPLPTQGALPTYVDMQMKFGFSQPQFSPQYEQSGALHPLGPRLQSSSAAPASSANHSRAPIVDSQPVLKTDIQQADFGVSPPALEDLQGSIAEHVPIIDRPSDDGYNWRKYGQKQVKGSEFPRSYYKCTYANCPVKKKVERSHDGQVTEIVYKGEHNHSKPLPGRRLHGAAPALQDGQGRDSASRGLEKEEKTCLENAGKSLHGLASRENSGIKDSPASGSFVDPGENPSTPSYSDDDGQGSRLSIQDGDEDGPNAKRRRMESLTAETEGVQRTIREPRVVVQTTSDIDILDDGYRWRKYGQKVVKGNPHPRSYYKCTNVGCPVRKHVERASNDPKSVITTYEGKHNHDVPAAKASVHENCVGEASSLLAQSAAFAPCIDSLTSAPGQEQTSSLPEKTTAIGKFSEHNVRGTSISMSATDLGIQLGINQGALYADASTKFPKQEALSFPNSTFMDFSEAFPSSAEDWKGATFQVQDHTRRLKQEENYFQPFVDSSSSLLDHNVPPRLVPTP